MWIPALSNRPQRGQFLSPSQCWGHVRRFTPAKQVPLRNLCVLPQTPFVVNTAGLSFYVTGGTLRYDSPSYRRWMTPDSPWRIDAADRVDAIAHNQLWRNHLLTWSMIRHPQARHAAGRCVVVRPPRDARGGIVVAGDRSLLREDHVVAIGSSTNGCCARTPQRSRRRRLALSRPTCGARV